MVIAAETVTLEASDHRSGLLNCPRYVVHAERW